MKHRRVFGVEKDFAEGCGQFRVEERRGKTVADLDARVEIGGVAVEELPREAAAKAARAEKHAPKPAADFFHAWESSAQESAGRSTPGRR